MGRSGPGECLLPEPRTCAPGQPSVRLGKPGASWCSELEAESGACMVSESASVLPASYRPNFLKLPKGLTLGLAASKLTFSVRVKNARCLIFGSIMDCFLSRSAISTRFPALGIPPQCSDLTCWGRLQGTAWMRRRYLTACSQGMLGGEERFEGHWDLSLNHRPIHIFAVYL